ncbi:MAG TPA: hypothetical protein P5330_03200 [Candidatus Competibacteraceae bacterium]|nr:hypothetical protein [Candidatus Competibacteraceae bacterium]
MNRLRRIQFNLSEASTKRGIALFIASGIAVYQMLFGSGAPVEIEALAHRAEFWLAIGGSLSGFIGMFFPDEPKTVRVELPPIALQGRSESPAPASFGRVHDPELALPPVPHTRPDRDAPDAPWGYNDF